MGGASDCSRVDGAEWVDPLMVKRRLKAERVFKQPVCPPVGFSGGSVAKNLPANAGDVGSTPVSGRSPGEGNSNHSRALA